MNGEAGFWFVVACGLALWCAWTVLLVGLVFRWPMAVHLLEKMTTGTI